jgi:hypothetical protein
MAPGRDVSSGSRPCAPGGGDSGNGAYPRLRSAVYSESLELSEPNPCRENWLQLPWRIWSWIHF